MTLKNKKIVFMASPGFAIPCLELLKKNVDIKLVVTKQDSVKNRGKKILPSQVKSKALELGLEVITPKTLKDKEIVDYIKSKKPDFIIVVAYGHILTKEILDIPKFGAINVHASLLPKLRGAAPIHRALLEDHKITGISIMKMDEGLDTGDFYTMSSVEITDDTDYALLENKLKNLGAKLLLETLENIVNNKANLTKQDEELATYAHKIDKSLSKIDWNTSGRYIFNQIRTLGGVATYKGKRIKLLKASFSKEDSFDSSKAGLMLGFRDNSIGIATKDGVLNIYSLQLENSKVVDAKSFAMGHSVKEKLGQLN